MLLEMVEEAEIPFIRMMSKIMKNEDCPRNHSKSRAGDTVFAFILTQFLRDSPHKLELDDIDGVLNTKSCSFQYKFLADNNASTLTMCSLPKQQLSREAIDCSSTGDVPQKTSALATELSFAAAVAVHERTYISEELDSGHYLSEWTNDAHRSFHNLNNLVDDRSFLQLKMEQHNSRKRRPSLFDAIDDYGYEREEIEAKQEVEGRIHHKDNADNPGREELSDSVDLGYEEAVHRKKNEEEKCCCSAPGRLYAVPRQV